MKDDVTRAFPHPPASMKSGDTTVIYEGSYGMTLRDYFAAKAMATLYANSELLDSSIASAAYLMADAMLEARK